MRSIEEASAAEASMLMRAISPSPIQLASGSNAAVHCGRSWLASTAKYDPQRRHTATVAIATSPKCSRDFAGAFIFLVASSKYERACQYMAVCGDDSRR